MTARGRMQAVSRELHRLRIWKRFPKENSRFYKEKKRGFDARGEQTTDTHHNHLLLDTLKGQSKNRHTE